MWWSIEGRPGRGDDAIERRLKRETYLRRAFELRSNRLSLPAR